MPLDQNLLEGIPLYIYGNSYTQPPVSGRATTGNEWPTRLKNRLNMGTLNNRGLSGSVMTQLSYELNNNVSGAAPSRSWSSGAKGLVVIEETVNDCVTFGGTAKSLTAYGTALRTMIELINSATRYDAPHATFTYTGTWTTGTAWLKNSGKRTIVTGSKVSFTFTGPAVTLYHFGDSAATNYAVCSVKEGATTLATIDTRNQMDPYNTPGSVGTGIDVNLMCTRVTGLSSGTHTIDITMTSMVGTKGFYFDGYSTPDLVDPPQIILLKEGLISDYSPNGSDSARVAYNNMMDTVASEYSNVTACGPGTPWDSDLPETIWDASCLYMNDGTGNHPNDKGNKVITDTVANCALSLGHRNGMHILGT